MSGEHRVVGSKGASAPLTARFRYDPGARELRLDNATGFDRNLIDHAARDLVFRLGDERGLVGFVAASQQALYVANTLTERRWVAYDPALRSAYLTPVLDGHELLGVFIVFSARVDDFSESHRALIDLHAAEIGLAWRVDRLADRFEREARLHPCAANDEVCAQSLTRALRQLANRPTNTNETVRVSRGVDLSTLSARELEVVLALRRGLRLTQVARTMGISTHTARNHLKRVNQKLGAHSQVELLSMLETPIDPGVLGALHTPPPRPLSVLYVEDNPQDADLLRLELSRTGASMTLKVASSLREARTLLDAKPLLFDVLLVDLHLPDGQGLELVREIRAGEVSLAVIALTGSTDGELAVEALRAGADDYWVKRDDYLARAPVALRDAIQRVQAERAAVTQPLRVLLVERSPEAATSLRQQLATLAPHLTVEHAMTRQDALARLPQHNTDPCRYDVLLVQQTEGDSDALDLLKAIRQARQLDLPIVLTSSSNDGPLVVQGFRFGATDHVTRHADYVHVLPAVLRGAQQRVSLAREQQALRDRTRSLRESEERFHNLFDSLPDAVVLVNASGTVTLANQHAQNLFGYDREELLGMSVELLMPESARGEHAALRARFLQSPMPRPMGKRGRTLWGLKKNGDVFPVDISLSPIAANDEEMVVASIRDMTLSVRAADERVELEAQLRQAQKLDALGTLAGGIAHDFNNILTIIGSCADAASNELERDHRAQRDLTCVKTATARAGDLVRRILTFSRKSAPQLTPVDVVAIVNETSELLRSSLPASVELVTKLACRNAFVRADATQLHQVLVNLCTNAWHALEGKRGTIAITVATEERRDAGTEMDPRRGVRLEVRDNGAGMDANTMQRAFEPFFTTKPVGQGTGLGLSVVHGIVIAHGGTIDLVSAPNEGTTFRLWFPTFSGDAKLSHQPTFLPATTVTRALRVLLVDDEPAILQVVARSITRRGHHVVRCNGAQDALAAVDLEEQPFDLVITDCNMPHMSGVELAQKLRAIAPALPVVLTSGDLTAEARERGLAAGIRHFLNKPFGAADIETLLATFEDAGDA